MASLSAREPVKPCHAANQIESGGSREMLQMGSLQPNITRPAQTHHSNALGDRPLKARYCSCGRIVTVRRVWRIDCVQSDRDGHT
jgi:hypothetical protein